MIRILHGLLVCCCLGQASLEAEERPAVVRHHVVRLISEQRSRAAIDLLHSDFAANLSEDVRTQLEGLCRIQLGETAVGEQLLLRSMVLTRDRLTAAALGTAQIRLRKWDEGRANLNLWFSKPGSDSWVRRVSVSDEDLAYGEEQFKKLTADLSVSTLVDDSEVADWLIRQFAGEGCGGRVAWDETPPPLSDADHSAPRGSIAGFIRVARSFHGGPQKGVLIPAERRLALSVFELCNIQNTHRFAELNELARSGKITRAKYIRTFVEYELDAEELTRKWYVDHFLPVMKLCDMESDPEHWFFLKWHSVKTHIEDGTGDPESYPWRPYGEAYDWLRVASLSQDGNLDALIPLLRQMADYQDTKEKKLKAWRLYISACMKEGRFGESLSGLNAALQIDRNDRSLRQKRVYIFVRLQKGNEAQSEAEAFLKDFPDDPFVTELKVFIDRHLSINKRGTPDKTD